MSSSINVRKKFPCDNFIILLFSLLGGEVGSRRYRASENERIPRRSKPQFGLRTYRLNDNSFGHWVRLPPSTTRPTQERYECNFLILICKNSFFSKYFYNLNNFSRTLQLRFDRHRARAHDDAENFKRDLLRE